MTRLRVGVSRLWDYQHESTCPYPVAARRARRSRRGVLVPRSSLASPSVAASTTNGCRLSSDLSSRDGPGLYRKRVLFLPSAARSLPSRNSVSGSATGHNAMKSLAGILLVVFIVLKLIGAIHWSWFWVLCPAYPYFLVWAIMLGLALLFEPPKN